jgi:hypothetical protein
MRVTMPIVVLGLSLGCGTTAALSQSIDPSVLRANSDIKSLAAPIETAGAFGTAPEHSLTTGARQLKLDAGATSSLKSGESGGAAVLALPDATRSSLSNRGSSVELSAGSVKPPQRQFFATAGKSSLSSFGLRSLPGLGASPSADSIKEPGVVQRLR